MKKIKKILSFMACFAMIMVSCFSLTACSKEEVAENIETVIETSSSIIPVELSVETAKGVFNTALNNWVESDSYEIVFTGKNYTGTQKIVEIGKLNSKGERFVYTSTNNAGLVLGYFNNKICELNLENKTYEERVISQLGGGAIQDEKLIFGYMSAFISEHINEITAGRYYKGFYYISMEYGFEEGGTKYSTFTELKINDEFIVGGSVLSYEDDKLVTSATFTFKYTNVDTSKVVMSLEGFTKAN